MSAIPESDLAERAARGPVRHGRLGAVHGRFLEGCRSDHDAGDAGGRLQARLVRRRVDRGVSRRVRGFPSPGHGGRRVRGRRLDRGGGVRAQDRHTRGRLRETRRAARGVRSVRPRRPGARGERGGPLDRRPRRARHARGVLPRQEGPREGFVFPPARPRRRRRRGRRRGGGSRDAQAGARARGAGRARRRGGGVPKSGRDRGTRSRAARIRRRHHRRRAGVAVGARREVPRLGSLDAT